MSRFGFEKTDSLSSFFHLLDMWLKNNLIMILNLEWYRHKHDSNKMNQIFMSHAKMRNIINHWKEFSLSNNVEDIRYKSGQVIITMGNNYKWDPDLCPLICDSDYKNKPETLEYIQWLTSECNDGLLISLCEKIRKIDVQRNALKLQFTQTKNQIRALQKQLSHKRLSAIDYQQKINPLQAKAISIRDHAKQMELEQNRLHKQLEQIYSHCVSYIYDIHRHDYPELDLSSDEIRSLQTISDEIQSGQTIRDQSEQKQEWEEWEELGRRAEMGAMEEIGEM
jgi:hypothetical protein